MESLASEWGGKVMLVQTAGTKLKFNVNPVAAKPSSDKVTSDVVPTNDESWVWLFNVNLIVSKPNSDKTPTGDVVPAPANDEYGLM